MMLKPHISSTPNPVGLCLIKKQMYTPISQIKVWIRNTLFKNAVNKLGEILSNDVKVLNVCFNSTVKYLFISLQVKKTDKVNKTIKTPKKTAPKKK